MRVGKIFKAMGMYPAYEVHAEQTREYAHTPSFEELGPGFHKEVMVGTLAAAKTYCLHRGLVPFYKGLAK